MVPVTGGTFTGTVLTHRLQPVANNAHDLGTVTEAYRRVYTEGLRTTADDTYDIGGAGTAFRRGYIEAIFGNTTVYLNTNGTDRLIVSASGLFILTASQTGNAANLWRNPADGRVYESTSSSRFKSYIADAPELAELELRPVTFHRDDDDADFIGFIAEDLADQDERIVQRDADGEVHDFDVQSVVAILAAKVNDLAERVAQLEGAS